MRVARLLVFLVVFLVACGGPPAPAPTFARPLRALRSLPEGATAATHLRFEVLPPGASKVTFERMAKYPEPGWQMPRAFRVLPGKKTLTYLASESGDDTLALFGRDLASGTARLLLRAGDLASATGAGPAPLSREEELRRERKRERAEGITSYRVAKEADLLVLTHGGDVFAFAPGAPVERLTRTKEPEIDPQPCATGAKVAWVRGGELVAYDRTARTETVLTKGATEGLTRGLADFVGQEELGEESGFWWSPRCDRIAYLEVDERNVASVPVAGHRNGEPDLMMQRYPRAGATNPKVRLGVLDLASRKTTWVAWPDQAERYLVRLAWTDDGRAIHLQALSRDQKRRALVRVDAATGAPTTLATETSKAWVSPSPMRVLPKRGEIVVTSAATGHHHLEVRRASDGGLLRTLTSGAWDVTALVAVDEARGRVLFTATRESVLERHLYEVNLDGGEVRKLTSEHGVHSVSGDEKGEVLVDVHSARDRLPRVDLRRDGAVTTLAKGDDAEVRALELRAAEAVHVTSPGGQELHGALLRPRVVVPGAKHPAVVMVYGGPTAQTVMDVWSPRLLWQHLADRGFFVFQLDNRGSAGRGPAFEHLVHGQLGKLEAEDQAAGVAFLRQIPEIDETRLGVYGHSYGGFMAAKMMLETTLFAAGVASAPVTDWRLYDTAYTERYMGLPSENVAGYEATDLSRSAERLHGHLLLVHANMDENVHYAHTAKLVDALVVARKPFDLLVFPGDRHGYRRPPARTYVNERIARFFAERL